MTIKSIEINNFKSIKNLSIDISELSVLVGKNGAGKTTILKAIEYFYNNLIQLNYNNEYFDISNKYSNELQISVIYDLSKIINYGNNNYSSQANQLTDYFKSNEVKVTMTQKKNEPISWNINYDQRYLVFNSHPIYFCDTRSVELTNWESLWNIVGDLINAKDAEKIIDGLSETLKNEEFKVFNEYKELFEVFLEKNDFTINSINRKNKVISLLQLQLGGSEFLKKNEGLDYFSAGTNSKSFITFLSYVAFEISNKRLKDATIFLDEPELGLHPKMIEELMEEIVKYSKSVKFVIFSHSPRIAATVIKGKGELYKINIEKNYTTVKKIVNKKEKKYQLVITDREAGGYFSDLCLFCEGISELELFTHPTLTQLFPFLKKIDVINIDSNDNILQVFHSYNSKIPYIILNDIDKVINLTELSNNKYLIKLKKLWYSPVGDNEFGKTIEKKLLFSYGKKESKKRFELKRRIDNSTENEKSINTSGSLSFWEQESVFIRRVKRFCLYYDLYIVDTTIEGTIINKNSYTIFNKWRKNGKTSKFEKDLDDILSPLNDYERAATLRILYSNKLDNLKKYKETEYQDSNANLSKYLVQKNTQWITKFFDYYQENILNAIDSSDAVGLIKKFESDFPELYDIIQVIERKISDE